MEQNREPRNNPCTYGQLIYNKGGQEYTRGRDSPFNKWCWKNWTATCKRIKLDYSLTPCTTINSKWNKDLNVRLESIKLLEENMGTTLFATGLCSIFFLNLSLYTRDTKAKIKGTTSN